MKNIRELIKLGGESLPRKLQELVRDIQPCNKTLREINEGRCSLNKDQVRKVLFYRLSEYRKIRNIAKDYCWMDTGKYDNLVIESLNIGGETTIPINDQGIIELTTLNGEVRVA